MANSGGLRIYYTYQTALFIFLLVSCSLINRHSYYLPPTSAVDPGHKSLFDSEALVRQRIRFSEKNWNREVKSRHARQSRKEFFWEFFNPIFDCPQHIERLGKTGPGGKWVCGLEHFERENSPCVVFSYGLKDDTIEDEILEKTNCHVYMFDPSTNDYNLPVLDNYPERTHFIDIALGAAKNSVAVSGLKSIMKIYKVEFVDILKVDVVDGSEFDVLRSILRDFPQQLPIGQILMEIHVGSKWGMRNRKDFKIWWESLEAIGLRSFKQECHTSVSPICCCQVSFMNVKVDHRILHGLAGPG